MNCCGGWIYDEKYLLSAVQKSKKLCSDIYFPNERKMLEYIDKLSDDYQYYCEPPRFKDIQAFNVIVTRKGKIDNYINIDEVLNTYYKLGRYCFNPTYLIKFLQNPMIELMSRKINRIKYRSKFDFANPESPEDYITTGLLLGYPLESKAWLLERDFY